METLFRILAAALLLTVMGVSSYYRRKADRESGETVPRRADGTAMMTLIRLGGLVLWLSPFIYLINPAWMAWSRVGLPVWARGLGAGLGVLCAAGILWLFRSLGRGITPTSATRREHVLVTRGPYRWVRHPLYTLGSSFFVSFGLMADNWFIAALGGLAFVGMAVRVPREEANLILKFGDEYRAYMKHTGRYLPRIG